MTTRYTFLVLVFFVACSDSRETRMQRFLIQGNTMAAERNYAEAKRYFSEAIRLDSCFADAWNNLGTVHHRERHYQEAVAAYTRAIACNHELYNAYLNRANTFYELHRYEETLADVNHYITAQGDSSAALFLKGLAHAGVRDFDNARHYLQKTLELEPDNTDLLINLANIFFLENRLDSARNLLRAVARIRPNDPHALNTLALIEMETGNAAAAMQLINRALEQRPADPYFRNNRGYFYLMRQFPDSAVADIDFSITQDPYNAWAYRNKGIYYLMRGDVKDAIRVLSRAEQLDAHITDLSRYLGEAWIRDGNREKGCRYLMTAMTHGEITADHYNRQCR